MRRRCICCVGGRLEPTACVTGPSASALDMEPDILRPECLRPRRRRGMVAGERARGKMLVLPQTCLLWGFVNNRVLRDKNKCVVALARLSSVRYMAFDTSVPQQMVWRNDVHCKALGAGYVQWTLEWIVPLAERHPLSTGDFVGNHSFINRVSAEAWLEIGRLDLEEGTLASRVGSSKVVWLQCPLALLPHLREGAGLVTPAAYALQYC